MAPGENEYNLLIINNFLKEGGRSARLMEHFSVMFGPIVALIRTELLLANSDTWNKRTHRAFGLHSIRAR